MRPLLHLVPALAVCALAAGEPLTATPWDVRKEASELLDEITRAAGEPAELIARAEALMAAHGRDLIAVSPTEAAPIGEAVADALRTAGLLDRFAAGLSGTAERRLRDVIGSDTPLDAVTLVSLARSLPGTPAGLRAWRLAADLAWDHGRLRLYHEAAAMADEATDPARRPRLTAAAGLLATTPADLPAGLDALATMWRIEAPKAAPDTTPAVQRRRQRQRPVSGLPAIAPCGPGAIAIADGLGVVVVDHLVGVQLGPRQPIGDRALAPHSARPEPVHGGAVVAGLSAGRLVLTCVDGSGAVRWRSVLGADGADTTGAPVALDGLVAVPYRVIGEDRLELRVLAVDVRTGAERWDTAVASLAAPRWSSGSLAAPAIARHARGLAVSSNAGAFALLGSDGAVRRLWTYPSLPDLELDGQRRLRRGLIASDGATVAASPADHAGLVLVLGPDDRTPRAFRGDGADGDVLAMHDGEALIAGRQVSLVDTRRLRLRWTAPLRLPDAQGMIGANAVLVAGTDQIALLGRSDGRMLGGRALAEASAVAMADGVLVLAEPTSARGFGDAVAFLDRLRRAAAEDGGDPRPHAALGAVLAGRGEHDGALAAWQRAIELGAGAGIAERMARLLRLRLVGGGGAAAGAVDRLQLLAPHLPGLDDELRYWRGMLAEGAGDRRAAAAAYAAARAAPDRPVPMADGLSVSLHLLAAAGQARLGEPGVRPTLDAAAPAPPTALSDWPRGPASQGRVVRAGTMIAGFSEGLLRGWRLADGGEAWWRRPQRPLLGVTPHREAAPDGVAIDVLPGSAGAAAGLRNGDVLLALDGKPMRDFDTDLRPAVLELGGGNPFTFTVRGADGAARTVAGRLGGEPLEPIAADERIVLVRSTMALAPGRTDLRVFAVDAADGRDLWSLALSHDEERQARTMPLLLDGTVIAADGPDLVGIGYDGAVRWRREAAADLLAQASPAGRALWTPVSDSDGLLLDPTTGAELARLPGSAEPPVVAGLLATVRDAEGRLAVYDLATGRLRCRSVAPARPLAAGADAVLALDQAGRAALFDVSTGALRRTFGDGVVETAGAGPALVWLATAGAERRTLTAIDRNGWVQRWSLDLPPGLEVERLDAAGDSLLAVLREGQRSWALLLDRGGAPLAVSGWPTDVGVETIPLNGAVITASPLGLALLRPGLPPGPAPLRCLALPSDAAPPAALAAALPRLAWSATEGPAIALARQGPTLLVAVRNPGAGVILRLCEGSGPIANDAVRALVNERGLRLAIPGSWTLSGQWSLNDERIVLSAWTPLPSRAPGSPLLVLLDGPADAPWWMSALWHRVLDPP